MRSIVSMASNWERPLVPPSPNRCSWSSRGTPRMPLSASSSANSGIGRSSFGIRGHLPGCHVPCRDDTDVRPPERERNEEQAAAVASAQSGESALGRGVFAVGSNGKRTIEEHLFGFTIRDTMHRPVLPGIPRVPLKTFAGRKKVVRAQCISPSYTGFLEDSTPAASGPSPSA